MMIAEVRARLRAELADRPELNDPLLAERIAGRIDDRLYERYAEGMTPLHLAEHRRFRDHPRLRTRDGGQLYAVWLRSVRPDHEAIERAVFEEVIAETLAALRAAELTCAAEPSAAEPTCGAEPA